MREFDAATVSELRLTHHFDCVTRNGTDPNYHECTRMLNSWNVTAPNSLDSQGKADHQGPDK